MASRRSQLWLPNGQLSLRLNTLRPSICPFCTYSLPVARLNRSRPVRRDSRRRFQSATPSPQRVRFQLEEILKELRRRLPAPLNTTRWDLALEALRQTPGEEPVKIAIWGLQHGEVVNDTAKRLLGSILADPLQDAQSWEKELSDRDAAQPLFIRIGPTREEAGTITVATDTPRPIHISSPDYNTLDLEIMCMNVQPIQIGDQVKLGTFTSLSDGPLTSISSFPVHKALLVADGLSGVVEAARVSEVAVSGVALKTANLPGVPIDQSGASMRIIDVDQAARAVAVFREGPQNAMEFERLWSSSGLPEIIDWIKAGTRPTEDGSTKPFIRNLIAGLLEDLTTSVQELEQHATPSPSAKLDDITRKLSAWSERAHTELQNELDKAFTERRWRKLGWWKLFWRVDDVSMLTNELLAQRFLPTSEKELVYLTGQIAQLPGSPRLASYPQPTPTETITTDKHVPATVASKWPTHISFARRYLQNETIPALQALAQRLVAQSLGTSGITSSLAGLLYISSTVTTIYEAAAVAALGIVYSLGRMQKKWERARDFLEGEAREEGRKAVKAAEQSVSDVLTTQKTPLPRYGEVKELLARAEEVFEKLK